MASPSDLAVVICHGSYHTPAPYEPLLEALRARGVEAVCPQIPSADLAKLNVGDVSNPDFDLGPPEEGYPQGDADTKAVLDALEPLVTQKEKRVLIVAHSSGGWVATQAAQPALQAKERRAKGLKGGIVGVMYMAAFIIPVGESLNSFFQPKDGNFFTPPWLTFHKHGAAGLGTLVEPEKYLFSDLDPAEAKKWSASLTGSPILTTVLTNDAYSALPCAYIVFEGDLMVPKMYQEGMVAAQAAKTGEFKMYYSPGGHSAHLSQKEGVADTIVDFAKSIEA